MTDHGIVCGACGATNGANAVVCGACGALVAAYATPAGASDPPEPPSPAATVTSIAPPPPDSPRPLVVEEQPTVASPVDVPGQPLPAEPDMTEPAAQVEPPLNDLTPTGATQVTPPAIESPSPPDEPAAPEPAVPAIPVEFPLPALMETGFRPEPYDATPEGSPRAFEVRWQREWSSRQGKLPNRRVRLTMTGGRGKVHSTGVPQLGGLNEWGPAQMLVAGIGLLLGSCVFLAIGSSVDGAGCLISLGLLGGVLGVVLTVSAARTLFGDVIDGE